jgi:hypothetical protein
LREREREREEENEIEEEEVEGRNLMKQHRNPRKCKTGENDADTNIREVMIIMMLLLLLLLLASLHGKTRVGKVERSAHQAERAEKPATMLADCKRENAIAAIEAAALSTTLSLSLSFLSLRVVSLCRVRSDIVFVFAAFPLRSPVRRPCVPLR